MRKDNARENIKQSWVDFTIETAQQSVPRYKIMVYKHQLIIIVIIIVMCIPAKDIILATGISSFINQLKERRDGYETHLSY